MGHDLVTWSPRVGSTGDNKYNVPGDGVSQLDGSFGTGDVEGVFAYDGSSFSTVPTIAEINAASGYNQVVALYNRRRGQYANAFTAAPGSAFTLPPVHDYYTPDQRISTGAVSGLTGLETRINQLLLLEGFASGFSFTGGATNTKHRGSRLAEMRKSLGIGGLFRPLYDYSLPTDETRGWGQNSTGSSTALGNGSNAPGVNLLVTNIRQRRLLTFRIPTWMTEADVSWFDDASYNIRTGATNGDTLRFFLSNTNDVPLTTGAAANMDFDLGSIGIPPAGGGGVDWSLPWPLDGGGALDEISRVIAAGGGHLCSIIAGAAELAASFGSTTAVTMSGVSNLPGPGLAPYLEIDFGA